MSSYEKRIQAIIAGKEPKKRRLDVLIEQGKYKEAVKICDGQISRRPRDDLLIRHRGHLHLYFGYPQQARSDFDTTERLGQEVFRTRSGRLHSHGEYDAIGVTYWMEGHTELALSFWRYTTDSLCNGRIGYAGMGGGIESGLLLWFGAVHTKCEADIALVQKLYEKRLTKTMLLHTLRGLPGAIVRFFMRTIAEDEFLKEVGEIQPIHGDSLLGQHERNTNNCYAHFAAAIRAWSEKRYVAYRKHLRLAAPQNGPADISEYYNVWPYFLAKYEIENFR